MAKFLTGDELNSEIGKIIDQADEQLIIVSPFIKLHDRTKDKLRLRIEDDKLEIILVFGKNEENLNKSLSVEDLAFLKTFSNIEIRYEKRLHAKYYANESSAILTSMNLYDFSQNNNIEFGILTKATLVGNFVDKVTGDSLDQKAFDYFMSVVENSELYFKREPKYKSGWLGLSSDYANSEVIIDKFDTAFKSPTNYVDQRKSKIPGYCIRTGKTIKFNPKRPFTAEAYKEWAKFKNPDFKEKFCHFSGEPSNGDTNLLKPILKKNWTKAKEVHKF